MLLFIPNEAVYAFLHEADRDVIDVALKEKVVLCSPATLFAVLAVVRQSVEQFQLERTSDEILRCLGGVTDEWTKFASSIDKVGRQLDTVSRTFGDELNGTRRRVFEKTLDEVDRLRRADADVVRRRSGRRRRRGAGGPQGGGRRAFAALRRRRRPCRRLIGVSRGSPGRRSRRRRASRPATGRTPSVPCRSWRR